MTGTPEHWMPGSVWLGWSAEPVRPGLTPLWQTGHAGRPPRTLTPGLLGGANRVPHCVTGAYACDPRPHTRMTRRRQSAAWLSSRTRSARLPHLAQRVRRSTVAKVMPGGRRDTGTALAGHLPQSLTRVRQAQQPRHVTIMRQVA